MRIFKKKTKKANWTTAFPNQVQRSQKKDRHQADKRAYTKEAREFIRRAIAGKQTCPVVAFVPELRNGKKYGHKISARLAEVHHIRGRAGHLLRDQRYWMAVSKQGHRWIHTHISEAREHGWISPIGQWNLPVDLPGPEACLDTAAARIAHHNAIQAENQRCEKCTTVGIYIRTRNFPNQTADVWMCANKHCDQFSLYWHVDKPRA